ncbi:MAG: hypothetical protein JW837_09685 [Sedimentisphaerales bacterium]|nr:hypothetical protein [Sedimentisphaerales bacterium]
MLIVILLPLIAGFVLLFLPKQLRALSKTATLIISAIALFLAIDIFRTTPEDYSFSILNLSSFSINLTLAAKPLGTLILMAACGFGFLIALYSLKTDVKKAGEYYGAILLTVGGSAGILLTQHLLVLLICWEIVTASLYLMIATGGEKSNFAATKSFAMIGASDGALLLGAGLVWLASGTFVISDISIVTDSAVKIIAFILLMVAAITKAGAMPFHTWLPTSGEYAPVSVMALLPAAIDKLLGIYLLVIIVHQLFIIQQGFLTLILAVIGSATIVVAVMLAMMQHNLKKLLSYHAVSQVGYMILGIATATPVGLAGGVLHMLNNAIYKCCLFLCGGAVEEKTGTAELDELGGLGKKMPVTFICCLIAALSISGVPPFNGFVSKWMVYQGVVQMESETVGQSTVLLWPVWLLAAMFGSALTLASFVKILHSVFLNRQREHLQNVKEAPVLMLIPMGILAGLCVILGVFYVPVLNKLLLPALGLKISVADLSTWNSLLATGLILVGIVIGIIIWIIGKGSIKVREVNTWYCGEKIDNEKMVIPGTHFYKTVSEMGGLKQLYSTQEKGWYDLYDQSGRVGLGLTGFLRWMHSGFLSMYLTWVTLGLLILLLVLCGTW